MARHPKWTIWIDHPYPFGKGNRGVAPIEEAIHSVYGITITYAGWPCWAYHTVIVGPASRTCAEAIARALLVMHLRQIREDTRLPWAGPCRFDLAREEAPPPVWVLAYERAQSGLLS
jgi:hypothetical protein